ncbi:hypothetical protein MMC25_002910 [Agyrium rufum]|nr:hypothetical protein [Agyrium rufum]
MDPLSLSATVLALASITTDVFRVVQRLQRAFKDDVKFNTLYFQLVTEKQKTIGWVNNMRHVDGNGLHGKVPPENLALVQDSVHRLEETYKRANKMFRKFQISGADETVKKDLVQRTKWVLRGTEEVTDLINLLKSLNEALNVLAPVLPVYSPPMGTYPASSAVGNATGSDVMPEVAADKTSGEALQHSLTVTTSPNTSDFLSDSYDYHPVNIDPPTIRQIYNANLRALSIIISNDAKLNELARSDLVRLRLWGIGLFDDSLSLDDILKTSPTRFKSLQSCLFHSLVNIAVTEESLLKATETELSGLAQRQVKDVRAQLGELLARDELVYMALERWHGQIEEEAEARSPSLLDQLGFITDIIETLFELLPIIRSIRQEHILENERMETWKANEANNATTSSSTDDLVNSTITPEQILEKNVQTIKAIEEACEKTEKETQHLAKPDTIRSAMLKAKREALEEFQLIPRDRAEEQRIKRSREASKMQIELAKALGNFYNSQLATKPTQTPSTPFEKPPSTSSKKSRVSRPRSPGEAKRLLDSTPPVPTTLDFDKLLSFCDTATSHLYRVAQG